MVLQAQGKLSKTFDLFVFANVGADSENPATIAYREKYVIPFAAAHGIAIAEHQRIYKGQPITLLEFMKQQKSTIPIPVYFSEGGKGQRKCTRDFKVEVVRQYLKQQRKPTHVELGLGFSAEEGHRIYSKYPHWHDRDWSWDSKTRQWKPSKKKIGFWQKYEYPLADLRLTKRECIQLVLDEFGEAPPESLCWYCPFTKRSVWRERKMTNSPLYAAGIEVESMLNDKYQQMTSTGVRSKRVGLHPDRIPLDEIGVQYGLWEQYMDTDEGCELGVCGL